MTTTLITGASKGLGKETARLLVDAGHTVWLGARDESRGRAAAEEAGARFVGLDVTGATSVGAALARIAAEGGYDVVVNNAGIANGAGGEVLGSFWAMHEPSRPASRFPGGRLRVQQGGRLDAHRAIRQGNAAGEV